MSSPEAETSPPPTSAGDASLPRPRFGVDEHPKRFLETLFYAWQHTMVDISPFVVPLAVAAAVGMDDSGKAGLISACLFTMGIATLIQTTFGNRLPIIQGCSSMVTGVIAPVAGHLGFAAMWGACWLASIVQTAIGYFGLLTPVRKLFPPVVTGTVIICIALSLGNVAVGMTVGDGSGVNWIYAGLAMAFIMVLQGRFANLLDGLLARGSILLGILTVGVVGGSLGGHLNWTPVQEAAWFALPQFFPYGGPGFGWEWVPAAILAVGIGFLGSIVESLGDYAATCAAAREEYTEKHMNRGIMAEGVGSFIASIFGGLPCTSYTQNIGVISATGVASRRVVQVAAVILALYGLCPKFGALLIALPRAALGGVFLLVCASIAFSGVRILAAAENRPRHFYTVGLTLLVAVALPPKLNSLPIVADWPMIVRLVATSGVLLGVTVAMSLNGVMRLMERKAE